MVAVNILYRVGSCNERAPLTGLAHLLEHLMFTGSQHVANYDHELQAAGGESNAWTSVDSTNYYDILPAQNLETALWLESDRLQGLTLGAEAIATQRSVVIEEFKQRCLNAPYGDVSHLVNSMVYTTHPYQWPPIGRKIEDIEAATADDVRQFHRDHYAVNNAILCISGNVPLDRALKAVNHWFGDIEPHQLALQCEVNEPQQTQGRMRQVSRDVPQTLICRAYRMPARADALFPACDILSDVLSNGKSARFYQNVMLQSQLFTELDASVAGTLCDGLFYVRARLADGADITRAQAVIDHELQHLLADGISDYELEKFVNKHIATDRFENLGYSQQAMRLCLYEQIGDTNLIYSEEAIYRNLTTQDIMQAASSILRPNNCSTLIYNARNASLA